MTMRMRLILAGECLLLAVAFCAALVLDVIGLCRRQRAWKR